MEQKITYTFYRNLIDSVLRKINLTGCTWTESEQIYSSLITLANQEGTNVTIETIGATTLLITKC